MQALARDDDPPSLDEDEAFKILEAFNRLRAEHKAGDIPGVPYERAIGVAVAKVRDPSIRDKRVSQSFTLVRGDA